jgi:hypothetical protein
VRFTSEGLAARATKGTGPSFSIVNGRAVYSTEGPRRVAGRPPLAAGPGAKRFPAAVRPLAA